MAIRLTYGTRQQFRRRDREITIRGRVAPVAPPMRRAVYRLNDSPETPFYVEAIPDNGVDWVNGYKDSPAELRCRELGDFAIEIPVASDALRPGENQLDIETEDSAGDAARTELQFVWDPTPPPLPLDLRDLSRFDDIQAIGQVINGAFDLDSDQNLIRSRAPADPDAFIILGGMHGSQEATYAVRFTDFTGVKWLGLADFFAGMEDGTPPRGIKVGWSSAGMATLNPKGEARSFIAWGDHSGSADEWVVVTDPPKRFAVERQQRYRVRHQVLFQNGVTAVRFRIWPEAAPEPEDWLVEENDRRIPAHLPRHKQAAFGLFQHSGMPIEWSDILVTALGPDQDLQS